MLSQVLAEAERMNRQVEEAQRERQAEAEAMWQKQREEEREAEAERWRLEKETLQVRAPPDLRGSPPDLPCSREGDNETESSR